MLSAVAGALDSLGLDHRHYAVCAAHTDTACPHVHVAIGRVDPETGRAVNLDKAPRAGSAARPSNTSVTTAASSFPHASNGARRGRPAAASSAAAARAACREARPARPPRGCARGRRRGGPADGRRPPRRAAGPASTEDRGGSHVPAHGARRVPARHEYVDEVVDPVTQRPGPDLVAHAWANGERFKHGLLLGPLTLGTRETMRCQARGSANARHAKGNRARLTVTCHNATLGILKDPGQDGDHNM